MSLKERLSADLMQAMKAADAQRVSVIRMLLSELTYAQTAVGGATPLSEVDQHDVLNQYRDQLQKSLNDFPTGPRRSRLENEVLILDDLLSGYTGMSVGDVFEQNARAISVL